MSCSCYFTNVRLHRFSIPFRFRLRNSNSDFNSTQSYLLIEHQELLILPFCITSCERVYVSEDAEDDTTSPLLLFTVDENKSPNRPSCPGFFNKIAETFSEAKALIDDEISVLLECIIKEVRKYECRKMANTIEYLLPFFVLDPPDPQSILEMILSALRTLLLMLIEFLLIWKLMNGTSFLQSKNAMQQELLEQPLDLSAIPSQIDCYWQHPMQFNIIIPSRVDCCIAPFPFASMSPRCICELKLKVISAPPNDGDEGFEILPLRKGYNSSDRSKRDTSICLQVLRRAFARRRLHTASDINNKRRKQGSLFLRKRESVIYNRETALSPVQEQVEEDDLVLAVFKRLPNGKRRRLNLQEQEGFQDRVLPVVQSLSNGKRRRLNEEPVRVLPVMEQEELEATRVDEYEESFDSDDSIQEVVEALDDGGRIVESSSVDAGAGSLVQGLEFFVDNEGKQRRRSTRNKSQSDCSESAGHAATSIEQGCLELVDCSLVQGLEEFIDDKGRKRRRSTRKRSKV